MTDDQGWGDAGYQGHPTLKTPHLDRMAAAGVQFTRFYSGSPVCSPTRGSALTGRHPERYGVHHANVGHLPREEVTLAEVLRQRGYATGFFGKWHLGTLTTAVPDGNRGGPRGARHFSPPQQHGFQVCLATESKVPTWDPLVRGGSSPRWWDPVADPDQAPHYGTRFWDEQGREVTDNMLGCASRVIVDRTIPFIEQAVEQEKPFLALVWFHAPHLPVVAGNKYTDLYSDEDKYTQHYYGCLTAMDEQVGRLRETLARLEVAENTLVWFCSDNGPEGSAGDGPGTADTLRGRKRDVYEGGVRVPGLLEWPARIAAGGSTDVPASTLDQFPTVVAALGLELSEVMPDERPIDGVNLLPILDGTAEQRPRPIPFYFQNRRALTDNRYKLVRYPGGGDELYDLVEDSGERRDLAAEKPEIVRAMRERYDAWFASTRRSLSGEDYPASDE